MLTLAIDTVTDMLSVALAGPNGMIVEKSIGGRRHATAVAPLIKDLLDRSDTDVLHTIIVADGPGSFTGLRIGFGIALGIRRVRPGVGLRTLPSLFGSAYRADRSGTVAALYDAIRGDVFVGVWDFQPDGAPPKQLVPPQLCEPGNLSDLIGHVDMAVGPGVNVDRGALERWAGEIRDPQSDGAPSAAALIAIERNWGLA
ncbi:MAG: tRNA (adenosine(37)-N6)-threonylcarbamoyltransferase complex dimerization subunit type 1 TsaB, partial [Gemmatimonadales bacterium]